MDPADTASGSVSGPTSFSVPEDGVLLGDLDAPASHDDRGPVKSESGMQNIAESKIG